MKIRFLLIAIFVAVLGFSAPTAFAAETIFDACNQVNTSSCDPNQFDTSTCWSTSSDAGIVTAQTSNTSLNWTASFCNSRNGCFVPVPGHTNDSGQQLGVCVSPVDPGDAGLVTCNSGPFDDCPRSDFAVCFENKLSAQVRQCDCLERGSGQADLCLFTDQEAYEKQRDLDAQIDDDDLVLDPNCEIGPNGTIVCDPIHRERISACAGIGCESNPVEWDLCKQAPGSPNDASTPRGKCSACQTSGGVWTAIGCITHTPGGIVTQIMFVGLSIAGGLALLMILVASFKFTVSKGDPKNVGEARELLQSAIIGLLFIVFSVTILQFIGVTIFQIPGFGS